PWEGRPTSMRTEASPPPPVTAWKRMRASTTHHSWSNFIGTRLHSALTRSLLGGQVPPDGLGHLPPVPPEEGRGREGVQHEAPVPAPGHPPVQEDDGPPVVPVADEAAESLLQAEDHLGQLEGQERVPAPLAEPLQAGGHHRLGG